MKYLLLSLFLFISCSEHDAYLPKSTGMCSEIIFVVSDNLWNLEIKDLAIDVFAKAIFGLAQDESLFKIIQINHTELKSILKTHTNIIIISENSSSASQKNKWSKGQYVAQLDWSGDIDKLVDEMNSLKDKFLLKEVNSIIRSFSNISQKNIENSIKSNFDIECIIPKEYQIINNSSSFFWASFNPNNSDEIKHIMTFSFTPASANLYNEVLFRTDSVFARYLHGKNKDSYVVIEPSYPPYYYQNTYRGLWKLENGFMGGPFVIKTYFIAEKIVVNLGLVFAPQSRKRKYIREFEAIL